MLQDWLGATAAATRAGRVEVLGCRYDRVTLAEAVEAVSAWVDAGAPPRLGLAVNAAKAEAMRTDAAIRALAARADLVFADGVGVVWAARIGGRPLPERVPGVELCSALLDRCASRGWRPYLLGSRGPVVRRLADRLRDGGVDVAGARDGFWPTLDEPSVVADVRAAGPDLLFVALGSPRQEAFLVRWGRELAVPWAMGVGGSFDVLAGDVPRAPVWARERGLEWAARIVREPRRLLRPSARRSLRYALRIAADRTRLFT